METLKASYDLATTNYITAEKVAREYHDNCKDFNDPFLMELITIKDSYLSEINRISKAMMDLKKSDF